MKNRYKLLITLSLAFVTAFAYESIVYNDDFLYEPTEVELKIYKQNQTSSLEEVVDNRKVASAERDLPGIQYIRYNDKNKTKINGKWRVTRIIDHKENVVFDVRNNIEDKDKDLFLDFILEGTSLVHATFTDGDLVENYYFDISHLTRGGSAIVLFRAYKNGYEILEAEKLVKKPVVKKVPVRGRVMVNSYPLPKNTNINVEAKKVANRKRFLRVDHVGAELRIERALYPTRARGLLQGEEQIEGRISLGDDTIEEISVTLLPGTPNEVEIQIDPCNINQVGHFHYYEENKDGEMVKASGLLTFNGEDGYRVRFVNGNHAGAMLSFVTDAEYEKLMMKAQEVEMEREMQGAEADVDAEVEKNERAPQSVGKPQGFSFSSKAQDN